MESVDEFEEAITKTGYGKFNILLMLLAGTCFFTVNMDAYSTGYILSAAQCDMQLTTADKGLLTTMNFLGIICSSHLWGYLADTRGRRKIIIVTLLLAFLCTLISSFSANFLIFATFRFWSGFFLAGPSIIMFAYLGEFEAAKTRTRTITATGIFGSSGLFALPSLAWIILQQSWSWNITNIIDYKPWRLFMLLCSFPCVIVALALLPFPESPKFLLERGKKQEALAVLAKIYAYNSGKTPDDFPIKKLHDRCMETKNCKTFNFFESICEQTLPLFKHPMCINTLVVCTLQFGIFAISSGLLLWYPDIVNQVSEYSKTNFTNPITVCEAVALAVHKNQTNISTCSDDVDESVFKQNIIIGIAYIIGFFILTLVINQLGKRNLLVVNLVVSGASGVALCWVTSGIFIDFLFVGLLVLSGVCVCVVTAAVVDLFPTNLRAMAVSISLMLGRLGSVAASSTIGVLLEFNCTATFLILSAILFACALLSLLIPNHSRTKTKETDSIVNL